MRHVIERLAGLKRVGIDALVEDGYRLNRGLVDRQRRLDEDLAAAAEIQSSLLPQDTPAFEQFEIAWAFEPSTHIAGDIFNVIRLDDSCVGIYVLDVSGHGVPAAMVAVSVCQNLQSGSALIRTPDPMSAHGQSPRSPAEVLRALDLEYPFERFSSFFTMVYLLIDTARGTLTCSNAGHPRPVILHNGGGIQRLKRGGPVIGLRSIRAFLTPGFSRVLRNEHQAVSQGVRRFGKRESA